MSLEEFDSLLSGPHLYKIELTDPRLRRALDAVERALCDGLCKLHDNPEKLRSMTNFEYLNVLS